MKKIYFILFFVFFLILSFVSGIIVGKKNTVNSVNCQAEVDNGIKTARENIVNRVLKSGACEIVSSTVPQINLIGTVSNIGKDEITIDINPISPLDDSSLDRRQVKIANAVIIKNEKKDQDLYKEEVIEHNKKRENYIDEDVFLSEMPKSYLEKEIAISDLKIGDKIYVETSYNIRNEKKLNAEKIIVDN